MRYGILGAAGYIAPRHMEAICAAGGEIVAAHDESDSVGIIDTYAPHAKFSTYRDDFDEWLPDLDCVVICTPNYQHGGQLLSMVELGVANVVVEKPFCIGTAQIERIPMELVRLASRGTQTRIVPVAQLRYHSQIRAIRALLPTLEADIEIDYVVQRGTWYDASWKAGALRSGGIVPNLGVHLVDLCLYLLGPVQRVEYAKAERTEAHGQFHCLRGSVRYRLGISRDHQVRRMLIRGADKLEVDLTHEMGGLHRNLYADLEQGRQICTAREALAAVRLCTELQGSPSEPAEWHNWAASVDAEIEYVPTPYEGHKDEVMVWR